MGQPAQTAGNLSLRRILGFACNQGFVFFLFYMGSNRAIPIGSFNFERAELFGTLLFMVVGFSVLRLVPAKTRNTLLARPMLLVYAVMGVLGSFIPLFLGSPSAYWLPVEGALIGLPCALLLATWGREFGETSTKISVPEVFVGSTVGALVGLIVSLIPIEGITLVLHLLPIASAAALMAAPKAADHAQASAVTEAAAGGDTAKDTVLLSAKIIAGTALFGMAAGFMETFNTDPGNAAMASYPVSLLLFGAFALGTLSLLRSDGFGRGAALNKAYRLALFIMMTGYLLIPVPQFAESLVPGEAVVLAGYLGLSAVLISLFLVLAKLTATDAAMSFSRGFGALFGGELVGVAIANAFDYAQPGYVTPYSVVVFAGILVLFSYVFLFTERDFGSLSEIVTSTDSLEDACEAIAREYGLSDREGEILPFALRGRTSERISQELHISKSTVDTHLRRIYAKAGVHSRQELIDLSEAKRG